MPRPAQLRSNTLLRRRSGERGATLVEMAIVLPLFLLLVFGIMEFSWYVAQNNEVRHLAREGARVAGVQELGNVHDVICEGGALVTPDSYDINGTESPEGGDGVVEVTANYSSLTPILSGLAGNELHSSHAFFVEPGHDPPNDGRVDC